jgi:hypothetical protein
MDAIAALSDDPANLGKAVLATVVDLQSAARLVADRTMVKIVALNRG